MKRVVASVDVVNELLLDIIAGCPMHLLPTVIKSLLVLLRKLLVIAVMSHFLAGKMLRHYIILSPTNNAFQ